MFQRAASMSFIFSSKMRARSKADARRRVLAPAPGDLALDDLHNGRPVLLAGGDPGHRLQSLGVGVEQVEQIFPGSAGAGQVAQRPFDQAGELAQVLGLLVRVGDHSLHLQVQDPSEV